MKQKFKINDIVKSAGRYSFEYQVYDVLTTTNSYGDVVEIKYVCFFELDGRLLYADFNQENIELVRLAA